MKPILNLILSISILLIASCSAYRPCKDYGRYTNKKEINYNKVGCWTIKHKYCIQGIEEIDTLKNNALLCGTIIDRRTFNKIEAAVNFNDYKFGTMADKKGYFEIILSSGIYLINVDHLGNDKLFIEEFELRPNEKTDITIFLGTTICVD